MLKKKIQYSVQAFFKKAPTETEATTSVNEIPVDSVTQ
jgi:hypothetical protein